MKLTLQSALKLVITATALCGFAQIASADDNGENYSLAAARVQGSLTCALSKNDGGSFDCSLHVKGQGEIAIDMMAIHDKAGKLVAFAGIDRLQEGDYNYTLSVGTDAAKSLRGVALITDNMNGDTSRIVANIATSESTKLAAAQISPLIVNFTDDESINIDLGFVVYGAPNDKIVINKDTTDLQQMLINKIRPYLTSLTKR